MRRYFGDHMTAMASRQLPAHQPRRELVSHSYVDSMELFQLAEVIFSQRAILVLWYWLKFKEFEIKTMCQ